MDQSGKEVNFLDAAIKVLEEADEPLHYREITQRAQSQGWLSSEGRTPWATMNARISTTMKRDGIASELFRSKPGFFGLRRWKVDARFEALNIRDAMTARALVPHFPDYEALRAVLPVWVGASKSAITGMRASINALRGTPQDQEDWSDPDRWIADRLSGHDEHWARVTWEGSGKRVNPRHTTGHWLLSMNANLLSEDSAGSLEITERGHDYLQYPCLLYTSPSPRDS